jgi:hypothetical protein
MCFHSPYNKLVVKSVGRLLYNDFVRDPAGVEPGLAKALAQWHPEQIAPSTTYADRGLDTALKKASAEVYALKCAPSATLSKEIGNSYTGALWMNLVSLVCHIVRATRGRAAERGRAGGCGRGRGRGRENRASAHTQRDTRRALGTHTDCSAASVPIDPPSSSTRLTRTPPPANLASPSRPSSGTT